jgi:hypothetical protein
MSGKQRKLVVKDELSLGRDKKQLNRLLIAQFYEDSVYRYGSDSEQACILSRLLSPTDVTLRKNIADPRERCAAPHARELLADSHRP